jgi:tryptophanyl-tRNA synthetase
MSLRDGTSKMSKSDKSDYSRINLIDDKDTIIKKIKKSKTADTPVPSSTETISSMPEVNNLFNIFSGVTSMSKNEIISKYEGQNFSNFKNDLSDTLIEKIVPIGSEIKKLMNDKEYLNQVLQEGKEKARKKSELVLKDVYDIVGFVK